MHGLGVNETKCGRKATIWCFELCQTSLLRLLEPPNISIKMEKTSCAEFYIEQMLTDFILQSGHPCKFGHLSETPLHYKTKSILNFQVSTKIKISEIEFKIELNI